MKYNDDVTHIMPPEVWHLISSIFFVRFRWQLQFFSISWMKKIVKIQHIHWSALYSCMYEVHKRQICKGQIYFVDLVFLLHQDKHEGKTMCISSVNYGWLITKWQKNLGLFFGVFLAYCWQAMLCFSICQV